MAEIDILSINNKKIQDVEARKDIQVIKENQINLIEDDTSMNGISDTNHDNLETTNKTIIGAINEVNSQFKDIAKQTNNKSRRYGNNLRMNFPKVLLKNSEYVFPSEFSLRYDSLPKVYKNKEQFITDFDVANYKNISGKTVYVDVKNGNSSNDGLTRQTPCQSVTKALVIADDGDTIQIINEEYTLLGRLEWMQSKTIDKNINIISDNKVIVFMGDIPTWSVNGNYNNVYETTRNNVGKVVDLNDIENKKQYKEVDSIEKLSNTIYSFYCDGTKTYINTNGNTPNRVLPILKVDLANVQNGDTQNIKVYLENIIFIGGDCNIHMIGTSTHHEHELYTKNCECYFSCEKDSILSQNIKRSYHQNTICAYSRKDGFNYSTTLGNVNIVDFIEVDCIAYGNGDNSNTAQTANTHNGSTAHAKTHGIRINGAYYGNYGGNVIDVQQVNSVNLGCITYDSLSTDIGFNQGIGSQQNNGAVMWLENCISFNNYSDIYCSTGNTITVVNSIFDTIHGNGTKNLSNNY